jgi:hypothetical protein
MTSNDQLVKILGINAAATLSAAMASSTQTNAQGQTWMQYQVANAALPAGSPAPAPHPVETAIVAEVERWSAFFMGTALPDSTTFLNPPPTADGAGPGAGGNPLQAIQSQLANLTAAQLATLAAAIPNGPAAFAAALLQILQAAAPQAARAAPISTGS